jgi:hypothetical protein
VWVNVDSSAAEMTSFLLLVSKLGHQVNSFKSQVEAWAIGFRQAAKCYECYGMIPTGMGQQNVCIHLLMVPAMTPQIMT